MSATASARITRAIPGAQTRWVRHDRATMLNPQSDLGSPRSALDWSHLHLDISVVHLPSVHFHWDELGDNLQFVPSRNLVIYPGKNRRRTAAVEYLRKRVRVSGSTTCNCRERMNIRICMLTPGSRQCSWERGPPRDSSWVPSYVPSTGLSLVWHRTLLKNQAPAVVHSFTVHGGSVLEGRLTCVRKVVVRGQVQDIEPFGRLGRTQ